MCKLSSSVGVLSGTLPSLSAFNSIFPPLISLPAFALSSALPLLSLITSCSPLTHFLPTLSLCAVCSVAYISVCLCLFVWTGLIYYFSFQVRAQASRELMRQTFSCTATSVSLSLVMLQCFIKYHCFKI